MDELPTDVLICIIENLQSLRCLITLRGVSRCWRNAADRYCTHISFQLARIHFHAFDDALLAIRLARIPHNLCCHYDPQQRAYSWIPSVEFLHAVMEGRSVPQGCPEIPKVGWLAECKAVMDLYLFALAWMSTTDGGVNAVEAFLPGTKIVEYMRGHATRFVNAFLRNFYRVQIFATIFGPRVFAEPVINAVQQFGSNEPNRDFEMYGVKEEVLNEMRRFPVYLETGEEDLFVGFFEWLYVQPHPVHEKFQEQDRSVWPSFLSEEQRKLVALLQYWIVDFYLGDRMMGETPLEEHHVEVLFSPKCFLIDLIGVAVYRQKLNISCWSEPQSIIDHWTSSDDIPSIVVLPTQHVESQWATDLVALDWTGEPGVRGKTLDRELARKFNMTWDFHAAARLSWEGSDMGLLYPLSLNELRAI